MAGIPLFVLAVVTVLMIQLQSISRVTMVLLTAPLGIIGIALFLLLFNQPFGFMAMLGTIALFGMIMRNSVILVDQIEQDLAAGKAARRGNRRIDRPPFPAHRPDRCRRRAGDDALVAQRLLRANGRRHHGRPDCRHRPDPALPAGALRGLV
jgi:energy-converting hydrogenase Eha subunit E